MKSLATIFYLTAIVFGYIGFNKLWVYKHSEYGDNINALVGGDAYNYIINANYATAYFILAFLLTVLASILLIIDKQNEIILNIKKIYKTSKKIIDAD